MSDEQTLLAVIVVVYLVDCLFWIPRNGLGFTRWVGKFWNIREPSTTVGNERGGLGFANPLPPLGVATRGVGWTISISEKGIFSYTSTGFNPGGRVRQKPISFEWADITSVSRDGKKILINGKYFATAASEYSSRWLAQEIARLQKIAERKRGGEIEKAVAASCDPVEAKRRVEEFAKQTRMLRYLANWLLIFLFAACPFLVWKLGIARAIWPVVLGLYSQTILIALLFSRVHRKIYPADSEQIFKPFLTMLLAAPNAIRAQDVMGRPLLEMFHPLAVAKALCRERDYCRFAAGAVRDLNFPRLPVVPADSPEAGSRIEEEFRAMQMQALRKKLSLDDSNWLAAPDKSEPEHVAYCPRCLQQFTAAASDCADCGGRPLVKF